MNDLGDVSGRVLLADDEDAIRRALAKALGAVGYQVVEASNGSAAAEFVRSQPFDVVVSDIDLPGADGIELLRLVRSANRDLPVLLMTPAPDLLTAVAAVSHGALDCLMKPVDEERLRRAVDQAVRTYALARAKRHALERMSAQRRGRLDRPDLSASFERALGGLSVAYQPIVRADGSGVYAYEALLRSREPVLPNPGAVLDAAELLGRIVDVGRAIRSLVTEPLLRLSPDALLFVNLHPRDLEDELLASTSSPLFPFADRVVFEITERSALETVDNVRGSVESLRAQGYRIAIDDLGAGYSGLTSFTELRPDLVKLDMSLVRGIDSDNTRQQLVGTVSGACKEMGLPVVAEGIETVPERDCLVDLGCDLLQGFLFARPNPEFVMPAWPLRAGS